jgi:hypothetical protein
MQLITLTELAHHRNATAAHTRRTARQTNISHRRGCVDGFQLALSAGFRYSAAFSAGNAAQVAEAGLHRGGKRGCRIS